MLAGVVCEGVPDRVSRPHLPSQRPEAEPSPKWRRHRPRSYKAAGSACLTVLTTQKQSEPSTTGSRQGGRLVTRPVEKHMHCKSYDNDFSYGFFTGVVSIHHRSVAVALAESAGDRAAPVELAVDICGTGRWLAPRSPLDYSRLM